MEMDMQITIAGGCGDFGRSCFFVEGGRHAFIVDAGTSTDGLDRVPDLTAEQAVRAEYLFITHSHRDHTGAIGYFESLGFAGSVLLTNQTYRQMKEKPGNTMILDSTAPELELERDFSFRWGRSGHCAGSVWYDISCERKKLFFSGDYRSDDPFYVCDDAEGKTADVAVLDAAYPGDRTGADMRRSVLDKILELVWRGKPLLLPVPHFGRGLSIAAYFRNKGSMEIPVHMAGFMTNGCVWGGGNTSPAGKCLPFPMKRFPYGTEKRFMTMGFISLLMPSCRGQRTGNSSKGILNFHCS